MGLVVAQLIHLLEPQLSIARESPTAPPVDALQTRPLTPTSEVGELLDLVGSSKGSIEHHSPWQLCVSGPASRAVRIP